MLCLFLAAVPQPACSHFLVQKESIVIAAACLGDSIAPPFGTRYGRHLFQMPLSKRKTVEGSLVGVFLGTVIGCYFYSYMLGIDLLPLRVILAYSAIAAISEATALGNLDNLVVPVVLHFSIDKVQSLLPS